MESQPPENTWFPVDPLGEALHSLRMSGTFYCRSELTAPWGLDLPAMPECLMFHLVTEGECRIVLSSGEKRRLQAGDFVLIPHGRGHSLMSDSDTSTRNIFDLPRELLSPRYELLRHGGGGDEAQLICGAVRVEDPAALQVVGKLPEMIVMQTDAPGNEWLPAMIRLMIEEAKEMRPGGDTVITRVSDLLVVQAIRHWLENDTLAKTGWLGALKDSQVGKAIALVHRYPTHPWSLGGLAEATGLSRSAFSARFSELVGESPMHYVRQWRFRVASHWLEETDLPIAEMAGKLGYQSEAAFNRAFKTFLGKTPGKVRRESSKR